MKIDWIKFKKKEIKYQQCKIQIPLVMSLFIFLVSNVFIFTRLTYLANSVLI